MLGAAGAARGAVGGAGYGTVRSNRNECSVSRAAAKLAPTAGLGG